MNVKRCDECGKEVSDISFILGNSWNGMYYDFCSYLCLLNFIRKEIQKEEENV